VGTDPTPPGQPEAPALIMPSAGEWTPEEIARFKERLKAAMANPGPLRVLPSDHWKDRAEAAEAKLAAIETHCRTNPQLAGAALPQLAADILDIIGAEEESRHG
jgi:hypothetical protein